MRRTKLFSSALTVFILTLLFCLQTSLAQNVNLTSNSTSNSSFNANATISSNLTDFTQQLPAFVSKNEVISKILSGVALNASNPIRYDNVSRPLTGEGPVNVQTQYRINRLVSVDPITNSFVLDIFLRLQWKDPRLVFKEDLGDESLRLSPS